MYIRVIVLSHFFNILLVLLYFVSLCMWLYILYASVSFCKLCFLIVMLCTFIIMLCVLVLP
jgi:hypothetical protein